MAFKQYRTYPYLKDPRVAQLSNKIRERKAGGEAHIIRALAQATGVSDTTIRRIFSNKTRSPYNRTVAALGIGLNFTVDDWMQHLRRAAPTAVPVRKAATK